MNCVASVKYRSATLTLSPFTETMLLPSNPRRIALTISALAISPGFSLWAPLSTPPPLAEGRQLLEDINLGGVGVANGGRTYHYRTWGPAIQGYLFTRTAGVGHTAFASELYSDCPEDCLREHYPNFTRFVHRNWLVQHVNGNPPSLLVEQNANRIGFGFLAISPGVVSFISSVQDRILDARLLRIRPSAGQWWSYRDLGSVVQSELYFYPDIEQSTSCSLTETIGIC